MIEIQTQRSIGQSLTLTITDMNTFSGSDIEKQQIKTQNARIEHDIILEDVTKRFGDVVAVDNI